MKKDYIIQNASVASKFDNVSINETYKDEKIWKIKGDKMNGKELKVEENTLTFGASTRKVNVFGLFKYKPNNNLYVIYTDIDTTYSVVHYGTSHMKNDSILSMSSNKDRDENIIKEYIFKVTEKEDLSNFEIINLDSIEKIEITSTIEYTKVILPARDKDDAFHPYIFSIPSPKFHHRPF